MKHADEQTRKKWRKAVGKILLVVIILGISIAFSKYNFMQIGHDFFMKFFTLGQQEQAVETEMPTETPTEMPTEMPTETPSAAPSGEPAAAGSEAPAPSGEPTPAA